MLQERLAVIRRAPAKLSRRTPEDPDRATYGCVSERKRLHRLLVSASVEPFLAKVNSVSTPEFLTRTLPDFSSISKTST